MKWEFIVCLAIIYQYGFVQIAVKKIGAVEGSRTRKLVWQYFFAASLALITAAVFGRLEWNWPVMIVAVIGTANAFGCYCHWRAYDISMSRTAMSSNLDDLIAIGLGYALLGELNVLTPVLTAGVVVSVASAIIFSRFKRSDNGSYIRLINWVLGYSGIWGVAAFSMRFFSVQGLSLLTFVTAWYLGSWLGALLMRFAIMGRDEAGLALSSTQQAKVFLLAVVIWTSLMLSFWMRELVPITVVQPILLVAEMSIPTVIAMILFGEAGEMSKKEIVVIIGGLIGIALIAVGY